MVKVCPEALSESSAGLPLPNNPITATSTQGTKVAMASTHFALLTRVWDFTLKG